MRLENGNIVHAHCIFKISINILYYITNIYKSNSNYRKFTQTVRVQYYPLARRFSKEYEYIRFERIIYKGIVHTTRALSIIINNNNNLAASRKRRERAFLNRHCRGIVREKKSTTTRCSFW